MRSRDRLPSQQEIFDGSTPSAELSPLEVLHLRLKSAAGAADLGGDDDRVEIF
jgi:hypothetical protein